MSEVILSESWNFLFGFISNFGHRIMGLVPPYAGRALLRTSEGLCNPLLYVLSLLVYTMVIETFSFSHFFQVQSLCFPVFLGHPTGVLKETYVEHSYNVGLPEWLTPCFVLPPAEHIVSHHIVSCGPCLNLADRTVMKCFLGSAFSDVFRSNL